MALMLLYMQPVFCGRARRYERSFADGAESRRGIMNNVSPTAQGCSFAQGYIRSRLFISSGLFISSKLFNRS